MRSRLIRPIVWVACFTVLIIVFGTDAHVTLLGLVQDQCELPKSVFVPSSSWKITTSTLPAQIAWQRAEQRPRLSAFYGADNSGITASAGNVLYWWRYWKEGQIYCQHEELIGLDSATGNETWRFVPSDLNLQEGIRRLPISVNFNRVTTIADGYIVVLDMFAIKLDHQGRELWRNSSFPSRATEAVTEMGNKLFFPSYSKVYALSAQTGATEQVINLENVINYWGDYALVAPKPLNLQILRSNQREVVSDMQLTDRVPVDEALSISLTPITERHSDILLVYNSYEPTKVEAYNITSGKKLWKVARPFYGTPIVVNNSIVLYVKNGLEIYRLADGKQIGAIQLSSTDPDNTKRVWLAGADNMIFIHFRETWEVVALKVDFPR